jgi:hypothetical protein
MSYKDVDPSEADRQLTEETIKQWRDRRVERLALEAQANVLKKSEQAMKSWLIQVFQQQEYEGVVIGQRITGLATREVHSVTDKEAFVRYIYDWEAIDLLQFRVSEAAILEREDIGQPVPGTEVVEVYDLYDRKA